MEKRAEKPPGARPTIAETPDAGLGDVLDFMRLLWGLNHELDAWSKQMDARIGVTGPQRLVIRIVGRYPGISAGHLAGVLRIHPSTLTGVLGRLEERGMIARTVDPGDRRKALFGLTARGRKLDALRAGTVESVIRRTLGKLAPSEVTAATSVLGALRTALQTPARGPEKATRKATRKATGKPSARRTARKA